MKNSAGDLERAQQKTGLGGGVEERHHPLKKSQSSPFFPLAPLHCAYSPFFLQGCTALKALIILVSLHINVSVLPADPFGPR